MELIVACGVCYVLMCIGGFIRSMFQDIATEHERNKMMEAYRKSKHYGCTFYEQHTGKKLE